MILMWRPETIPYRVDARTAVVVYIRYGTRTVRSAIVVYIRSATVPYRTVHQLTCRVDGGAALGMRTSTVLYCTTCRYGSPHFLTGCVRYALGICSEFVREACFLPASLHARRQAVGTRTSTVLHTTSIRTSVVLVPGVGRTVLNCSTCRYGSPHFRPGCIRDLFAMRWRFVRDSFGMPAFLPASLHAGRSYAGRTVLYCTTCRYGSPLREPSFSDGMRWVFVRDAFEIRSRFVRNSFGMPAFLPASLHAGRQAVGTRTSTVLHTTSIVYSYISRTRGRSYGTVGATMRPRCGDPPNKVCTAVGKLDKFIEVRNRENFSQQVLYSTSDNKV